MIDKDNKIMEMLHNIIEQTTIIKNDLERNGATHYNYMLEKLGRAKWDLDLLVKFLKKYEGENN